MTAEQIDKVLEILANTPTQVILWLALFMVMWWLSRTIAEGLRWFRLQLEKYMDRDRDIITTAIVPQYNIQTATRWQSLPQNERIKPQP